MVTIRIQFTPQTHPACELPSLLPLSGFYNKILHQFVFQSRIFVFKFIWIYHRFLVLSTFYLNLNNFMLFNQIFIKKRIDKVLVNVKHCFIKLGFLRTSKFLNRWKLKKCEFFGVKNDQFQKIKRKECDDETRSKIWNFKDDRLWISPYSINLRLYTSRKYIQYSVSKRKILSKNYFEAIICF